MSHRKSVHPRYDYRTHASKSKTLAFAALCLGLLLNTAPHTGSRVTARGNFLADGETLLMAKADPLLQMIRRAVLSDEMTNRASSSRSNFRTTDTGYRETRALSRIAGIESQANLATGGATRGATRVGLIVTLADGDDAELKAAGFAIGSRLGQLVTIETEVERIAELAALESVSRLTVSTRSYPNNDLSRRAIGVDSASGQRVVSQTGRGVIVAIIDDGIDFCHLDFTVPGTNGRQTRIKALLDMTVYSSQAPPLPPDPNWNYLLPGSSAPIGRLYTEADINAALQGQGTIEQRNKTGHGTHVAGTAAGNGLAGPAPGKYAGIAPEADLIVVKASRQNDATDNFLDADQVNALAFVRQKAAELGEPFVINMSMAGHAGPHDGTRANERAIDEIVNSGSGRAVCVSGGSTGDMHAHASGNLAGNANLNLQLNVGDSTQLLWLSYAKADNVTVSVTRADGVQSGPVAYNPSLVPGLSDQFMDVYNTLDDKRDTDPQNDQKVVLVLLKPGATALGPSPHTWTFTLHSSTISNGHFDAWASLGGDFVSHVDDTRQTTIPGTARGGITVGGYVTRAGDRPIGDYASFSSAGPTADGRLKPEISAPAFSVYSSKAANSIFFNSPLATDSNFHVGAYGNSFSTPAVTGAIALLFQVNPQLTTPQIKEIIKNTAVHDSFTGSAIWHERFGAGKLDIATALNSLPTSSANSIDEARFFVRQHYLDFLNRAGDQSGLDFWTNQITGCGTDAACLELKKINVSAAYFLSIEFQETGYLTYRMYKAAYDNISGAPVPVTWQEFLPDTQAIGQGVQVGVGNWAAQLESNKNAFAQAFISRTRFTDRYPTGMTAAQFVDGLNQNAGGALSSSERDSLVDDLANNRKTRAQVLRAVAEDSDLTHAELNRAFVLMQYFGYLRRDPNSGPDTNFDGYNFWLNKLNEFNGNFINAEMVKAFIVSGEYRRRFGL
ncbi:MAG TPA: S8 family serine peptidase [Pyrinomonadaceae bacterium]|jgi:subtilisin family serine protease|nr:S8 family serine peptidase [Pyrinomonadaceae bacterium]